MYNLSKFQRLPKRGQFQFTFQYCHEQVTVCGERISDNVVLVSCHEGSVHQYKYDPPRRLYVVRTARNTTVLKSPDSFARRKMPNTSAYIKHHIYVVQGRPIPALSLEDAVAKFNRYQV